MAEALELRRTRETHRRRITVMVALSIAFLALLVVFAVFGTFLTPHDHEEQRLFVSDTPPSAEFWAGTDQLGRDVFSRTIIGARPALVGAMTVSVGAFAIATVLGLSAGYLGGATHGFIMRCADLLLALPGLSTATAAVCGSGRGLWVAVPSPTAGAARRVACWFSSPAPAAWCAIWAR